MVCNVRTLAEMQTHKQATGEMLGGFVYFNFSSKAVEPTTSHRYGHFTPEVWDWLEEHVGANGVYWQEYLVNQRGGGPKRMGVLFSDPEAQRDLMLLFKLTWGGA
jgi:hypothetical protein